MLQNPERHLEHLHHVREDLLPILIPELLHLDLIAVETRERTLFEEAEDATQQPQLRMVRLANRNDRKERYTIDIEHGEGVATVRNAMQRHGLSLTHYLVDQAKISFKFRGIQKTGWFTADLSLPDTNNLGGEPKHAKIREYLKQWGVINHEENPA